MALRAPAGIDDLADSPDLRDRFMALWNDNSRDGFLGRYVTQAAERSSNYVDSRLEAPTSEPIKIIWNGFPRALSRWHDDELSTERKAQADATADVTTREVYWIEPINGRLQVRQIEQHRLAFFGPTAVQLAQPLRRVLTDGTIGDEVHHVRRQQDEYLEWFATRDRAGRLITLTFTAEPPDYWSALAKVAPKRVLKLYRDLVGPDVQEDDLFFPTDLAAFGVDLNGQTGWFNIGRKGDYDELNPWTTTKGIVHLTHRANTLGAEVFLAADASHVLPTDSEPPPTARDAPRTEIRRIACGQYGGINRSSDPNIGLEVGKAVVGGARVTLTDPIGLYVANTDISSLQGPGGEAIGNRALTIVRGHDDPFDPRILRFEVKLPDGLAFGLQDCIFDSRQLAHGGQIARLTTMHLYAQTFASGDPRPAGCSGLVCRHPTRRELFIVGNPKAVPPGTKCPNVEDSEWLLETPEERVAGPQAMHVRTLAADTRPRDKHAPIDVGRPISTSRARPRP